MPTMTQAQIDALIRRKMQAIVQGAVVNSTMFDRLEVLTPDSIPGSVLAPGSIADVSGPRWQHRYEENKSATHHTPGGSRPAAGSEKYVECSAGWGVYTAAFELNHLQMTQLLSGSADDYIIDSAIARQQGAMVESTIGSIETDMMTGTGPNRLTGIAYLITDTGTVYNQAISSYPTLGAYRNTAVSPRSLSSDILRDVFATMRNTYKAFKNGPIYAWCPTAQKNAAEGLTATSSPTTVISDGGMPTHQIAKGRVFYDRAEFIDVPGCTSGTIYLTEADKHKLVSLPADDGSMWHMMPVQLDGDLYRWELYCYIQQVILGKSAIIDELS